MTALEHDPGTTGTIVAGIGEMTLVDLSMPVADLPFDPGVVKVESWKHADGPHRIGRKAAFAKHLPLPTRLTRAAGYLTGRKRIDQRSFPDGLFLGNELLTLSVHAGTHVDAPFHYGPTCAGAAAKRIQEVPLDWCVGPGVVLRLTHKQAGESITVDDVTTELDRIGHRLRPGEIVLLHTGSDRLWPTPAYFGNHPGMSVPALEFLLDNGIRMIGTDTAGFDLPAAVMIERYYRTGDASHLWPCHLFGREREYLQIERMGKLGELPAQTGFTVCCLPVNVHDAGAGWARPVALVPAGDWPGAGEED